jgi:protein-S-isoprenylcysteine O-methyltransferase Ste14
MAVSEYLIKWGITGFIWCAWCVLHSLLNSEGPTCKSGLLDSPIAPYYRLIYSIFAAITLFLAWWVTPKWQDFQLWRIEGPALVLQLLAWSLAGVVFCLTFRIFNIWYFLGLTPLGVGPKTSNSQKRLITSGIYGLIRHPQFAAGFIILWMRDLTDAGLIINIVLSVYLIVGARIEETRLLAMYGNEYAEYMKKVPRFIPNRIPSIQAVFRGRSAS